MGADRLEAAFTAIAPYIEGVTTEGGRRGRVRLQPRPEGMEVKAVIAARNDNELSAVLECGSKVLPWSVFVSTPEALLDLVVECLATADHAVATAPPSQYRPTQADLDDAQAEKFRELLASMLTETAGKALVTSGIVSRPIAADAVMLAALDLATLAAFGAGVSEEDTQHAWATVRSEFRARLTKGAVSPLKFRSDA